VDWKCSSDSREKIYLLNIDGGTFSGKELLGGKLEDNIRIDLRNLGFQDGRWYELIQICIQWWAL
jgi:hypothetical protein